MPHANYRPDESRLLPLDNSWTGDNTFNEIVTAPYYDYEALSASADLFNENSSSIPTGWVERDAATTSDTDRIKGFWYLQGKSTETSFSYSKQTSFTEASDFSTNYSVHFNDIFFKDGDYTADAYWYFSVYKDDAGSLDSDNYVRATLYWDSTNSVFKIRGEYKTSGTETLGTWRELSFPYVMPLFIRVGGRNMSTQDRQRVYVGTTGFNDSQSLILFGTDSQGDFDEFHVEVGHSRGAGVDTLLYIGSVDYSNQS